MSDEGKHCLIGPVTRADFALSIWDQEWAALMANTLLG
jgi:hypothetical protein